ELPPKVKNAASQWHRHELRWVLSQLAPEIYTISPSLKNLLQENDRLELSDLDLAITSHISQIEQNSENLRIAYELLLEETQKSNVSLIPLTEENPDLLAFKNKKYAPLRYYFEKEELLTEDPPQKTDKSKRKYDDKKLTIENLDVLRNIKLSDQSNKVIQESDLILILSSDIVSFGIMVRAIELEKQIKKVNTPIVLIWSFDESEREISDTENEIAEAMEFGSTLDQLADDLSNLTDYIIIKKSDKEYIEKLRESGCHVLVDDIWDEETATVSDTLLNTIFSVGKLVEVLNDQENELTDTGIDDTSIVESNDTVKAKSKKGPSKKRKSKKKTSKTDKTSQEDEEENGKKAGKSISQLTESPEEAGVKNHIKDEPAIDPEIETTELDEEEEVGVVDTKNGLDRVENEDKIEVTSEQTSLPKFAIDEEEEWIDTVKRAIELSFEEENSDALSWLIEQSKVDNDDEVQIAEEVINTWIDSRTNTMRRKGAANLAKISFDHRDTYLQILQRHMISAVTEGKEDQRRRLVPLLSILHEVDTTLSEALVKGITRQLSVLRENYDIAVIERAKLTILQLVISSKRLSKITINELLQLIDSKPNVGPEIWNILIAFDAGSVALELVTNFSLSNVEEIVRRSNLLRFTGSYYSTFSKVMQAWKEGDKGAISTATGSILPEETLRKFERLELARKVEKLKMVQLSTLAESLGRDVETVERLITELIVNDELHAKMKLIEDKMYLVADEDLTEPKSP
ncbi:MAG: hypothetical protein ACW98K_11515, partial [Candidatus Kariarchaeaceae archaeon]